MTKKIIKQKEFFSWCQQKKIFNYVDIRNYSLENFYLRAERTIRDFVSEGKIRRISDEESLLRGLRKDGNARLAWFEVV